MKYTIYDRLLRRELGLRETYCSIAGIYGDRKFTDDLDIVNELGHHSGCVNALCWSRSGKFLASGSDDQHVNIHSYHPENSTSQFAMSVSIATGHSQNIFSVKFMPYSNDRTVVSAAGDSEVRVFDIEYSGQSSNPSNAASRSSWRSQTYGRSLDQGTRLLTDGNTNCRVYKSHSDRVKRIVTESSPYLFLTCSEDGEVRQWDLRQRSSAYPAPQGGRQFVSLTTDRNVPPPLISYKRYHLDLNTISCSPSQPQYIALGGAHLHCFLHDRRMTGRDLHNERGDQFSFDWSGLTRDDDLLNHATRCVRKFAPNGKRKMKRSDNGHITACKISDSNPNEMIVSWSGDWIYSFDILRSPDASEKVESPSASTMKHISKKCRREKDRKRKRDELGSGNPTEGQYGRNSRGSRNLANGEETSEEMSLRIQYENGQTEVVPIDRPRPRSPSSEVRESLLPESQRRSYLIAKRIVRIRKQIFTTNLSEQRSSDHPTDQSTVFANVLSTASILLPEMDELIRTWRYPVNPLRIDVEFHTALRRDRASSRRFVQACGTLARVLKGSANSEQSGEVEAETLSKFIEIVPAPNEAPDLDQFEAFAYDFLRAILLWLESGIGNLVRSFTKPREPPRNSTRYPIPLSESCADAVDDFLIPYLLRLASERPIINVEASRFEVDDHRILFQTEKLAVLAFARALKIPFEDLSSAVVPVSRRSEATEILAQDRKTALKFWGLKVGRGLLINAGSIVDFAFVDRAFGGMGKADAGIRRDEAIIDLHTKEISLHDENSSVTDLQNAHRRERTKQSADTSDTIQTSIVNGSDTEDDAQDVIAMSEVTSSMQAEEEVLGEPEDVDDVPNPNIESALTRDDVGENDEEEDEEETDDDDDDDDDEDPDVPATWSRYRASIYEKRRMREDLGIEVPCNPHTRLYRGHCNIKTVKDVNFYGMRDEYVVSGSDSGHVFMWDRKTTQLVNILEGDGEVVNVVQGHPYEPMLAVSGIDHTVKIFSPDAYARSRAKKGIGIDLMDSTGFSSLCSGFRRYRSTAMDENVNEPEDQAAPRTSSETLSDSDDDKGFGENGLASRKRMHLEYKITSENDAATEGRNQETFITRRMLAQLMTRLHERGAENAESMGGSGPVVITEDCATM